MKIVFTGLMGAGKDYLADKIGFTKVGFADPIYLICDHFFGTHDKSVPEIRKMMQCVGVWGRGCYSPEYPATIERALFCDRMRNSGGEIIPNHWQPVVGGSMYIRKFGLDEDFWINTLINRLKMENIFDPKWNIAVTNARFPKELDMLIAEGFEHYHVMCDPETLVVRNKNRGMESSNDVTERMAEGMCALVLSCNYKGKVVWNDDPKLAPLFSGDVELFTESSFVEKYSVLK